MFPGGRRRAKETTCATGNKGRTAQAKAWTSEALERGHIDQPTVGPTNERSIFIANKASGLLRIGDKREIDRASWRNPRGVRLTPTSRYIRDKLFPSRKSGRAKPTVG
jgi:hypothetical protein